MDHCHGLSPLVARPAPAAASADTQNGDGFTAGCSRGAKRGTGNEGPPRKDGEKWYLGMSENGVYPQL